VQCSKSGQRYGAGLVLKPHNAPSRNCLARSSNPTRSVSHRHGGFQFGRERAAFVQAAAGMDRATSPRAAARTTRRVHRRDDGTPGSAPTRKIGCDQLHTVPVIGRVQAQ